MWELQVHSRTKALLPDREAGRLGQGMVASFDQRELHGKVPPTVYGWVSFQSVNVTANSSAELLMACTPS
jgi:hypothetical protein